MANSEKTQIQMVSDSLILDANKPDFKELDLGSPVSPLRSRGSAILPTTSSGSSSSGSVSTSPSVRKSNVGGTTNSGEFSGGRKVNSSRPGHRRSISAGTTLIYSGGSFSSSSSSSGGGGGGGDGGGGFLGNLGNSVSSPNTNLLPTGNICPSGKIVKGMACRSSGRPDVLGSGTGNYGHGSIMRGGAGKLSGGEGNLSGNGGFLGDLGAVVKRRSGGFDPEEVKKAGNEQYRKGNFTEALLLYDRAIGMSPENAAYRSNRAAALAGLGRLGEAVKECEEAVKLDSGYGRAHQRLASLYLRLGQIENARHHLCFSNQKPDPAELQKLLLLEKHLNRCADARKIGDWKSALRECDAAMAAGVDSSPQVYACKAEALLKLHQLEDADLSLSNIPKFEPYSTSSPQTKFFGINSEAYVLYVRAQIDMALGRFESAVATAEKAGLIDYSNIDIAMLLNNVKLVARARARGNDLFSSGKFVEACSAYGEGLKYDSSNSVLYCNRAVCWSKLGLWEQSVEDCNQALKIQPNYTKALLRRAVSNSKLERWTEAVRDYEILRRELPGDNEVAESLFHAKAALKKSRGEEIHTMKFGSEVEGVCDLDQFKAAISSSRVLVVHFKVASNQQCEQISPFVETLCARYPSVNFLKVDIEENPSISKAESIRNIPTFKIYKNGVKVKEMICPSHQVLEYSVRHYSL